MNEEKTIEAETAVDEQTMVVINDDGSETTMEILFTFDDDQFKKSYVLYINPEDESGEVFVSSYTAEGALDNITDDKEMEMIEEVFNAFVIKHEGEEDAEQPHEHNHENCSCGHEH